jgi:signal transduction histidine kinase
MTVPSPTDPPRSTDSATAPSGSRQDSVASILRGNLQLLNLKSLPLQSVLIVPFVLQVLGAVGLTAWFSLHNGQKAVNDVASQLRREVTERVGDRLWEYLETPHIVNQLNANAFVNGDLNFQNVAKTQAHFLSQLRTFRGITENFGGIETGQAMGAVRSPSGSEQFYFTDGSGKLSVYAANDQGKLDQRLDQFSGYQLQERPWYAKAKRMNRAIWTDVFLDFTSKSPVITASQPIYDRRGNLVGVLGSSLFFNEVQQFLSGLKIGKSGQVFIMDRTGNLVSTSTDTSIFQVNGETAKQVQATESENPTIRQAAKHLRSTFQSFEQIQGAQQLELSVAGEKQFLQVTPWRDARGLDWLIVVLVPESDFMAQINANTRTTILLCLGASVGAILIGIYTSHRIIRPIAYLSKAAEAIAAGKLDQTVDQSKDQSHIVESNVTELATLSRSFNHMALQLNESFTTLAQTNAELSETLHQLQDAQVQVIKSEKMSTLGNLVSGVAHEINNPVGFLVGNLKPAQNYIQDLFSLIDLYQAKFLDPDPEVQKLVKRIDLDYIRKDLPQLIDSMREGTDRITDISVSLRNFSRSDTVNKVSFNLHDGIDSTLLILKHRLKANEHRPQIQVIKNYGDRPEIQCFPGQLNQVFMNILANAIDALDEKSEAYTFDQLEATPNCLTISTTLSEENQHVTIHIQDNAAGMEESVRSHIFDHLFTTKGVGKGTGLGLAIARQIVEETHEGKLVCHSTVGEGTAFVIELPL